MIDDLSRPARLPSEAIALPAMEPAQGNRTRRNGALVAVRRNWPKVQPEQRTLPEQWEDAGGSSEMASAADPVSMGRAALRTVLSGAYHT